MRDAVDPPDFHPPRGGQFVDEPLRSQLRVIRVVQDEIAPGDEVRRPGVEVPPHAFVRMVAVEPQESDRLRPSRTEDLAARVEESYLPMGAGPNHVPEEGRPVRGAELPAPVTDERLVRLDRVDGPSVTVGRPTSENDGRAPAVTANFYDAALGHALGKLVKKDRGVTRQPSSDRGYVA